MSAKQNGVLTNKEYSEKAIPILEEKSILEEKQRNSNDLHKIIEQNKEKFDNLEKLKAAGLLSEEELEEKKILLFDSIQKNKCEIVENYSQSKPTELSDGFFLAILIGIIICICFAISISIISRILN